MTAVPPERGLPPLHPVFLRPWLAVVGGIVAGIVLAAAGVLAWNSFFAPRDAGGDATAAPESLVDLFRLPSGTSRELLVIPAGPDCSGEPVLSRKLFPGEDPPRRLATVLLANVSDRDAWDVDLDATPLRYSAGDGRELVAFDDLDDAIASAPDLSDVDRLRLRSLGAGSRRLRLEPGTLRHLLVVLPPNRQLSDLSHVQWGVTDLQRDRLDLGRVHLFREDPAAAMSGR